MYQRVTSAIISAIEAGAGLYRMPWVVRQDKGFSPISISTVKPYRGVNTLVLWAQAQYKGYSAALGGTGRLAAAGTRHTVRRPCGIVGRLDAQSGRGAAHQHDGERRAAHRFVIA